MKAMWKETVVAESAETVVIEGNHYFPPEAVNRAYLRESKSHTNCPWKGVASYLDIVVDDDVNKDAAWFYPEPKAEAEQIRGHVAFWKGVAVVES